MRTIAVISQKGGAGKTTLALHIAVAAEQGGCSTILVDMDPQGTAEAWSEWRKEAPPVVIPAKAPTLAKTLEKAAALGAELAIVDTPPLAEAEARAAMRAADLILVPCRPNAFDLHSIKLTADMVSFAAKPAFVVFNAGPVAASRMYGENSGAGDRDGHAGRPDPGLGTSGLPTRHGKRQVGSGGGAERKGGGRSRRCLEVDMPTGGREDTPTC